MTTARHRQSTFLKALAILLALAAPCIALAQTGGLPALTSTPGPGGSQTYTLSIQTLITLTALTFIPLSLLMLTSFTRIIIVLSILRHALGTQTSPPNQILIGLSLFLTFFIMSPIFDRIYAEAYQPLSENRLSFTDAIDRGAVPLRGFMLKQTRETDIGLFMRLAKQPPAATPDEVPMRVLIPAFVTSELKTAFQIGFMIFIPFLVIDMVVSSILMSLGMMMLSPVLVALPFKLMLFVLADGWNLLIGSLAASFAT